ncbi:hypothetical protein N5E68_01070 [Pseudomonas sp. GD03722]|nr:hypothetical protein [Pseudomonas sp. GD03722]MDH1440521.1 hypothetical protein [Pseudomonas sp. GD03722]
MHSCCAPCSGEVTEAISASGIELHHLLLQPHQNWFIRS